MVCATTSAMLGAIFSCDHPANAVMSVHVLCIRGGEDLYMCMSVSGVCVTCIVFMSPTLPQCVCQETEQLR